MKMYHFCATKQGESAGELDYADGVLQSNADFSDANNYHKLKMDICRSVNWNLRSKVVLLSLTVIHEG